MMQCADCFCCGSLFDVRIAYTRDRLGNVLSAVANGVSTNLYAWSREGLLTNEVQNGVALSRLHDALGRPTGYTCRSADDPSASSNSVAYSYDAYGRLSAVSLEEGGASPPGEPFSFTYDYLPGTDLVSGYASGDFFRSVSYEPDRNLIASVENSFGDTVVSRFDYTNDALGRRTAIARSGAAFAETAFERYAYNDRSEVVGSQRYHGNNVNASKESCGSQYCSK